MKSLMLDGKNRLAEKSFTVHLEMLLAGKAAQTTLRTYLKMH